MIKYLITILITSLIYTASVDRNIADRVVLNLNKQYNTSLNKSNYIISNIETIKEQETIVMYAYHLNPIGFVLVSGTDKANPVIGYSFDSNLKLSDTPDNFTYFINKKKSHLFDIINTNSKTSPEVVDEWNLYTVNNYQSRDYRNVSPLIDAEFDQSGSWNNTLTAETGFNGPVGCVAVAMAQIMYYWGFPEEGQGSNTYIEDDLGELSVDFSTTYYDFDNMAATYATNPSRLLLYHSGVAVNMDYDNSGSGAQCEGVYPSAEYAMETFFKYSSIIHNADGDIIDNITEFRNILKDQLDYGKPILFSGFSDSYGNGGHAWNVDGYQNNNLHCNWGWGGWNNGYYNLTTMDGFDTWQNALIDLIPNIYESPLALFEFEITDNNVLFIDLSEIVNEEEISTWEWDFGDGNNATNSFGFAEHAYEESGEYTASLTITNIYGQTGYEHTETFSISSYVPGDVNSDNFINVLDIVMLVNFILDNQTPSTNEYLAADYNSDGLLNVLDIVSLVNEILN